MFMTVGQSAADTPIHVGEVLWAKDPGRRNPSVRPYPLLAHLLDTAVVAGVIWDTWLTNRLRDIITEAVAPGDPAKAKEFLQLAAGLHDIGKANPIFTLQAGDTRHLQWREAHKATLVEHGLPEADPAHIMLVQQNSKNAARRHEYISKVAIDGPVTDPGDYELLFEKWLSVAIAGHHGYFTNPDDTANRIAVACCSGTWGEAQQDIIAVVSKTLGINPTETNTLAERPPVTILLISGLVILADWLASEESRVAFGQDLIASGVRPSDGAAWVEARTADLTAHTIMSVGFYTPPADPLSALGDHAPRPLQSELIRLGAAGGLTLVAYPTGEGKSEASWLRHMAVGDEGLLFALPTRATTDAMQSRLEDLFDGTGNAVVLSHMFAAAKAPKPASTVCGFDAYGTEWFTSSVRRLVAPVSAMTCDQVLAGALNQKHIALRLLALANHHVVLDEVHTYDHYQSQLLCELLAWWGATGARVTLLSATLPKWQQVQFLNAYNKGATGKSRSALTVEPAYPSVRVFDPANGINECFQTELSSKQPSITAEVVHTDDKVAEHVRWAVASRLAHPTCHIAVIINTVDACIKAATRISDDLPGHDVVCLHSRMTQRHRAAIESELRLRLGNQRQLDRPLIVVATQVIEASLDIDFDLMSTDLAPAASLVQRAGRQWRFRDDAARAARFGTIPARRLLHIVASTQKGKITFGSSLPYLEAEMVRVYDYLTASPTIRVPEGIQGFVDVTSASLSEFLLLTDATAAQDKERIEVYKRISEASHSRADLIMSVLTNRDPTYADLAGITEGRAPSDETMRTRYIDAPGATYLLIDSRDPKKEWAADVTVKTLSNADVATAIRYIGFSIPASYGLEKTLRGHHEATLNNAGLSEWNPRSRMLSGLLPLDLALVEAAGTAHYSTKTGLTRKDLA